MIDASQAEREARLLAEGRERILERVMSAEKAGKVQALPYANYLIRQALEGLASKIKADTVLKTGPGKSKKYALYLGSLNPEIVALRAIQALLGVLLENGAGDSPQPIGKQARSRIGKAVYHEYLMEHFKQLSPPLFNSLRREYSRSMTSDEAHIVRAFKAKYANEGYAYPVWPFGDVEHVGAYLLEALRGLAFVEIWNRTEKPHGKIKTVQYLVLAEDLRSASLDLMDQLSQEPAVASPLIEPPKDWDATTNSGGGFHTADMQRQLPYAVQRNGLRPVAPAVVRTLNALQAIPWEINEEVLDAVRATAMHHEIGSIVSAHHEPPPEFRGDTDEEKREWKSEMRQWYTDKKVRAVHHMKAQRVFIEAQEPTDSEPVP